MQVAYLSRREPLVWAESLLMSKLFLFDDKSGRSAAWLARYLGVVEVVGSNPAGPIFV